MTLADEDTNSIQTDNAKRAFQGNLAMQVAPPGGHIMQVAPSVGRNWNQCKWRNLVVQEATTVGHIYIQSK